MRPTLAEAVVSLLLGIALATLSFPSHGHPVWQYESSAVVGLSNSLTQYSTDEGNAKFRSDPQLLQQWLVDGIEPDGLYLPVHPETDIWGNTYRLAIDGSGLNAAERIDVYSLGEDGKTTTNGNDPDDINSWTEPSTEFYDRRLSRIMLLVYGGLGVLYGIGVWLLFFQLAYWLSPKWKRPSQLQTRETTNDS